MLGSHGLSNDLDVPTPCTLAAVRNRISISINARKVDAPAVASSVIKIITTCFLAPAPWEPHWDQDVAQEEGFESRGDETEVARKAVSIPDLGVAVETLVTLRIARDIASHKIPVTLAVILPLLGSELPPARWSQVNRVARDAWVKYKPPRQLSERR